MAAKSKWVGRVPPVKFRKPLKYKLKVFLRARREALKNFVNLVCIPEQDDDKDEIDDEETLCDWKDDMVIAQAMGLALRRW
ncbi:hypothetical protein JCM24511_06746 [Saitozyma sp. JCM 24511]|nr:hypothetical protein JCM24511_06746 [Saitozyma sp. JCM 24511]